jgi:hypothetical protein
VNRTDCTVRCPCEDVQIEPGETKRVVVNRQPLTGEPLDRAEVTNRGTGTIHVGATRKPLEAHELRPLCGCPSDEAERDRIAMEAYKRGAGPHTLPDSYSTGCDEAKGTYHIKGNRLELTVQDGVELIINGERYVPERALAAERERADQKTGAHSDLAVIMGEREDRLWACAEKAFEVLPYEGNPDAVRRAFKERDLDALTEELEVDHE